MTFKSVKQILEQRVKDGNVDLRIIKEAKNFKCTKNAHLIPDKFKAKSDAVKPVKPTPSESKPKPQPSKSKSFPKPSKDNVALDRDSIPVQHMRKIIRKDPGKGD